jgi:hypothetical protein
MKAFQDEIGILEALWILLHVFWIWRKRFALEVYLVTNHHLSCSQRLSGFGLGEATDRQRRTIQELDSTAGVDRIGSKTDEKLKDIVVFCERFCRRVVITRHIVQWIWTHSDKLAGWLMAMAPPSLRLLK